MGGDFTCTISKCKVAFDFGLFHTRFLFSFLPFLNVAAENTVENAPPIECIESPIECIESWWFVSTSCTTKLHFNQTYTLTNKIKTPMLMIPTNIANKSHHTNWFPEESWHRSCSLKMLPHHNVKNVARNVLTADWIALERFNGTLYRTNHPHKLAWRVFTYLMPLF